MIISRTPFRISFVGGGTDLKSFYNQEDGQVLNTSINKYLYVAVKRQLDIVEHKYRICYSKIECTNDVEEIQHPIVREALKLLDIDFAVEITTFADIPAQTGLGSSSSFAVGLLHALFALKGQMVTKATLANLAAEIEINILGRNIGKQDHYAAAYGDLNVLTLQKDGIVVAEPVFYDVKVRKKIENSLLLFYTSIKRDANEILTIQNKRTIEKFPILKEMKDQVPDLRDVISSGKDIDRFGAILNKGWELKRSITEEISSTTIDGYYQRAMEAGALGGKLLGAGGGGFLLFYAHQEHHHKVKEALSDLFHLNFSFDQAGTRITYYDQNIVFD